MLSVCGLNSLSKYSCFYLAVLHLLSVMMPEAIRAEVMVPTTLNGASQSLAWQTTLGQWQMVDGVLTSTDITQSNLYSGEGARIFLPYDVEGDFDFNCEFFMPDNTTGAGGPVVYFRGQDDSSLYAFRYVNYWGTAVMQKKTTGQPWVNMAYATGISLGAGQWHDLTVSARDNGYSVAINGQTLLQGSDASLSGGALGLGTQVRQVNYRDLSITGSAGAVENWSMSEDKKPYTVVCSDAGRGGYQAFPGLCRLDNGDLLSIYYAGWGHVSRPEGDGTRSTGGAIAMSRSTDGGKTWGASQIVMDTIYDDRDPAVWQADDGSVMISTIAADWPSLQPPYDNWCRIYTARSTDGGQTFSQPTEVKVGTKSEFTAWTEPRRLANGDWLWPVYRNHNASTTTAMLRSKDDGLSWSNVPEYVDANSQITDEPDICQFPDGTLFCAMRPGSGNSMLQSWSHDNGATWSAIEPLPFYGHCSNLLYTSSGITLLACRDAGVTLHYSLDQAKTWTGSVMLDPCGGVYTQMVELPNGNVLIDYYTEASQSQIRSQILEVTPSGIRVVPPAPAPVPRPTASGVVNVTTGAMLFYDDFEGLGTNVSHTDYANSDGGDYDPIGGSPGSWIIGTYGTSEEPGPSYVQVTDATGAYGPGAYQGNNYLRIVRQLGGAETAAKMTFANQGTTGDHIRFSQMFYAASGSFSPIQVIGKGSDGANRFNILTDYSTPNVGSYAGTWPPTGSLGYTNDQWEEWVIDYNIGDTFINLTIGGNQALNVPILTGGDLASIMILGGEGYCMIDEVPEPSMLAMLAAGIVGLLAYAWRKQRLS